MATGSSRMFSASEVLHLLELQEEYEETIGNQVDLDGESDDGEPAEGDFIVNGVDCLVGPELISKDSVAILMNDKTPCERDSVLLLDDELCEETPKGKFDFIYSFNKKFLGDSPDDDFRERSGSESEDNEGVWQSNGSGVMTETSRVRVTRGTSTKGGITRGMSRGKVRKGGVGVVTRGLNGVTTGSRGKRGTRRSQGKGSTSNEEWIWSLNRSANNGQATLTFSGNLPGPTEAAKAAKTCTDCFLLYFGGFIDELLTQSNIYANQQRAATNDISPWTPITKEEMYAFVGVNIAMGVVSLPAIDNYWSTNPILVHQWFRTVMSRNRYRQILRYVHIADNSKAPSRSDEHYDKLWKVRPFLDHISERSQDLYNLHPHVSIDESMIGTKCRLSFIQYMPQKPTKWGLKVWVLADATTGYIYSFEVYTGTISGESPHPKGLSYGVVMKLMDSCLNKGHTVYTDNFYSSPELLFELGTLATGTVRINRKHFPKILKPLPREATRPRGTPTFAYHDNITVVRWTDSKDVYAISTADSDDLTTVKRQVDGSKKDVTCPVIISNYNSFMIWQTKLCYYSVDEMVETNILAND